jgi:hypothetical protein
MISDQQAQRTLKILYRFAWDQWKQDGKRFNLADYEDEGMTALTFCLERYDTSLGIPFSLYARRRLYGAIHDTHCAGTNRHPERQATLEKLAHNPVPALEQTLDITTRIAKLPARLASYAKATLAGHSTPEFAQSQGITSSMVSRECTRFRKFGTVAIPRIAAACFVLWLAACSHEAPLPPAIPDVPRFVPTLPTMQEFAVIPPEPPPMISPVDIPPPDAVEVPRVVGKKIRGTVKQDSPRGRTEEGTAIVKYPYRFGAIYEIPVGVTYPLTIMFPVQWIPTASPMIHAIDEKDRPAEWTFGHGHTGKGETVQAIWYIRPNFLALDATTPVLFETGQFMVLHLKSQAARGVLALTWDGTETQSPVSVKPVKPVPTGPRPPKIALDRLHIQYKIEAGKSPVAWMPAECYDDGNLTVVRFPESL